MKEGEVAMVEPIAIIGMGCRFLVPLMSRSSGNSCVTELMPLQRYPEIGFDVQDFYHPQPATPGKIMSRCGGFFGSD